MLFRSNGPIEAELEEQDGDVMVIKKEMIYPDYSISVDYLKTWIEFLRHCGGFRIW